MKKYVVYINCSIFMLLINTSCTNFIFKQGDNGKNSRQVYVANGDSILNASVWTGANTMKPKESKMYYWYYKDIVKVSQGSYFGSLLHGDYTVLDTKSKTMVTKGNFEKGLKDGKWMRWYPNGILQESSYWKDGQQVGKYTLYDNNGKVVMEYSVKERKKQIRQMQNQSQVSQHDTTKNSQYFWNRIFHSKRAVKDSIQEQAK